MGNCQTCCNITKTQQMPSQINTQELRLIINQNISKASTTKVKGKVPPLEKDLNKLLINYDGSIKKGEKQKQQTNLLVSHRQIQKSATSLPKFSILQTRLGEGKEEYISSEKNPQLSNENRVQSKIQFDEISNLSDHSSINIYKSNQNKAVQGYISFGRITQAKMGKQVRNFNQQNQEE